MPALDIADDTFLVVPAEVLAATFADQHSWRRFWPDLVLHVYADRGHKGLRWTVHGPLTGTMEVWLEPVLDGTVLHYFLRADLAGSRRRVGSLRVRRERRRRQTAAKRLALSLKAALEDGRPPGCPAVDVG